MPAITLGVIADTHIPDRAKALPLSALDVFSQHRVSAILHAGDLSGRQVLHVLEEIAPVHAVRGNTDLLLIGKLPRARYVEYEGVTIGIAHGHGSLLRYLRDKAHLYLRGPKKFSYYEAVARTQVPGSQVVVYGHNHAPANRLIGNQLIFNPGSPTNPNRFVAGLGPSVGLLHLEAGNVRGEIVFI